MIPPEFFAKIEICKETKDRERDDLLDDFELKRGIDRVAPAVCWYLEAILKKCDSPTNYDHHPE